MADWWNSTPSYFDREAYERHRAEAAKAHAAKVVKLREEEELIEGTADPTERLRLRRERYECYEYVTLEDLEPWATTIQSVSNMGYPEISDPRSEIPAKDLGRRFTPSEAINKKVYLYRGDITELEVDGIVNAANSSLLGGGGIDGAIHSAAGPLLVEECRALGGCETGMTKITKGYSLPAKYVLHTVGPFGRGDSKLKSCYTTCLEGAKERGIRSIAFCCVGTGIYSFPLVRAAHIALRCVREWMELHPDSLDAVIFCVFQQVESDVYETLMPSYFPSAEFPDHEVAPGDADAVPISDATIAAELAEQRAEASNHNTYYTKWVAGSPADEDEQLKAASVERIESNASMYE